MNGGTVVNTIATAYNADGEVTSTGDNYSDYAFAYSGQGKVTSVDNAGTPGAPHVALASQYDAQGDRTSLAATLNGTPDFFNSYTLDALSRLREIDQQGQVGGNAVAQKSIYLKLNGIGEITEIDRSNMVNAGPQQTTPGWTLISYDTTTGLLDEINNIAAGTSIDDLTYTHDTLARISTFGSIDGLATYGYDNTSQLVSATYTTATGGHQPADVFFTWDANGNNAATGNVVSPNNEVTNDGTFTYQFDTDGNRTVRTRISSAYAADYRTEYSWDYRNRLTDVEFFDNNNVLTKHVHYVYSVYDGVIEEDIDSTGSGSYDTTENFVLDVSPKLPVQVLSLSGTIDTSAPDDTLFKLVNGNLVDRLLNAPGLSGVDEVVADEAVETLFAAGAVSWPLGNNQNAPTDTVDSNGTLIKHRVFSAMGQETYDSNPAVANFQGFAAGRYDPNTGMINNWHRWYDPKAAVWISFDPAGFRAGDANLFRNVRNNPIGAIDPSGLANLDEWWTSFWNPIDALAAKDASEEARRLSQDSAEELGCDQTSWNGPEDALRHAIWNALMAQSIGADEAKKFGDAHEADSDSTDETAMDLWNNAVGRAIGAANPDASSDEIAELVLEAYENGELRILSPTGGAAEPGTPLKPTGSGCSAPAPRPDPGVPYNNAPGNPYPAKPARYPQPVKPKQPRILPPTILGPFPPDEMGPPIA